MSGWTPDWKPEGGFTPDNILDDPPGWGEGADASSSKAARVPARKRGALLSANRRMVDPPACEHGHFGCSCTKQEGGPCAEELSRLGSK